MSLVLPKTLSIQPRDQFKQKWAADRITLVDIAVLQGGGPLADLIDVTAASFPEVTVFGMKPIPGVTFDQLVRIKRPKVNFRKGNEGAKPSRSTYANKRFECFIFNPRWEVDKAVCDRSPGGAAPIIAEEAAAIMESTWEHFAKQLWYGLANDTKGFPGLTSIYDAAAMEVDATGTTAGEKTSVWAFRLDRSQSQFLLGLDGDLNLDPVRIESLADDDGNRFTGYVQEMLANIGFCVKDIRAVARAKNVTSDSGKGCSDDLLMKLVQKFPTNQRPTVFFMNTTQGENLRKSRVTDLLISPPWPTDSHNIPIVYTDAIVNGETA